MFEQEVEASSIALDAPLGDGPSGVIETSTAIGGNSNWSSQDSESRATTFSMSLASASAAAASEPEPSGEGMADLQATTDESQDSKTRGMRLSTEDRRRKADKQTERRRQKSLGDVARSGESPAET